MRAVVQRVKAAKVTVDGETVGAIGVGLLVYLGVGRDDADADRAWLADKICGLRIFEDESGHFNKSLADAGGEVLVVSQFTLYGDCRKGRRPSFSDAAGPEVAEPEYERFAQAVRERGFSVATGTFGAMMDVESVNWEPVTMLIDSKKGF